MKTTNLIEGIQFGDIEARGEPLYVDKLGRVIRFALKPGQSMREHNAPSSPVYIVVLKGKGMFAGGGQFGCGVALAQAGAIGGGVE